MKKFYLLAFLVLVSYAGQCDNPVIAIVNGKTIYLAELTTRKSMIPELANVPLESVFDPLREQMVAEILIAAEVEGANLSNDPQVAELSKKCIEAAKRQVFIGRLLEKLVTDEMVKELYQQILKNFKKQREVKVHHVMVASDDDAKKVIAELDKGRPFEEVAMQYSMDANSKQKGGELGFITKDLAQQVLGPDFAEATFILRPGNYSKKAVKTKAGYHVVKVSEERQSKPPKFEEAAQQLRAVKAQEKLMEHVNELKTKNKVQVFDMQGKPATAEKKK